MINQLMKIIAIKLLLPPSVPGPKRLDLKLR